MAPSFNSPKQELEQGICGQHGWSSSYFQAPSSRWCVEVRWGVGPRNGRVFVSDDVSDGASKAGVKKGHAAAATVAIAGLRDIVYAANSRQNLTIVEAFGAQFDHTCFVTSGLEGWAKLWEINPTEVFIDVEGNQVTPPVLVQVCVPFRVFGEQHDRSLCLLEVPNSSRARRDPGVSEDMNRLLGDPKITKVFCDGTSGADRRSLGVVDSDNYVDLEDIASSLVGATGVRRGLARIMNLAWPNPEVRVAKDTRDKQSVLFFAAIEQGKKPRPKELDEIPNRIRRYAAMDAWCTMTAYRGLRQQAQHEGLLMTD
ncbi:predicted protein [Micromonas commoda]|uniref:3'-5' exonuclease domain-containing protein n=1 Tax=Micromonas commoda (strain RCC299 / NOUM17 / CCMP2709) TaxID=296587 RepID=C1E615_MICCC|nr:predicted protein [Micromonas commoda]ACO63731.1 predicted protein [Micromonas commoda]|eukprot:XP_002502473.1 predicted protein [Micromonas commoda]